MRRVKMLVSGGGQGVYFRYFTERKAEEMGVMGSVRNLDTGHVEIIAEADDETLNAFIRWCHKGPITARVDSVDISELASDTPLIGFVRN
ncbi:MAG: acylphosphatase [Methylococcales bacterium]|nr:acylphosphatase [Methylococcales bacterium]